MSTHEQRACRQQFSEENLDMLRANPENFFLRIIKGDEHGSIIMIQRPNKSLCNGNTRGPLLPRNFVCNNQRERTWQQFFSRLRSCSGFGIKATQDNYYWRQLCSTLVDLRENIKQKPVESCRLVSSCFMTMHPHTSHTHCGLL